MRLDELDVHRLSRVIGTKPDARVLETLASARPRRRGSLASGLKELGAADLSRRVVKDAWLDPDAEELPRWIDCEPAVRREILPELLFGAGPERDALYRKRLVLLLAEDPDEETAHAALASVRTLPAGLAGARFHRRFAPDPELGESALALLPGDVRKDLVDAAPAAARDSFDALAKPILVRALGRPPSLGPHPEVSRVYLRLLLASAGEGRAAFGRLARSVMGSEADDARTKLTALLAREEAPAGEAGERAPNLMERASGSLDRWKERLKRR